jgi:glycerophosphoryl diester phosphodiesterase
MATSDGRVQRIAHRGAPRERLENTLPGFLLALERGADAIELDVHVSADGRVVVHHDDDVRGRPIVRTTWDELERTSLTGGARIPLLDDVLQAVADRATVYIEIKAGLGEAAVVDVARRYGARYAFHSFDHACIERVAGIAPEIPRGVLLDRGTRQPLAAMRAAIATTGARDVWPHWSLVDAALIAAARASQANVIAWTVNSPDDARRLTALGVSGLCTDDVRLLATV